MLKLLLPEAVPGQGGGVASDPGEVGARGLADDDAAFIAEAAVAGLAPVQVGGQTDLEDVGGAVAVAAVRLEGLVAGGRAVGW